MEDFTNFRCNNFLEFISEIQYLESQENYTFLHFANGNKRLFSYTLKHFESQLIHHKSFTRIHRRFMVNKHYISSYSDTEVQLISGKILPVARRRRV